MEPRKRAFPFSLRNSKAKEVTDEVLIRVPTTAYDTYTGSQYYDGVSRITVEKPLKEVVEALVANSNLRWVPASTTGGYFKLKGDK